MKIGIIGYTGRVGQQLLKLGCEPIHCDVTRYSIVERAIAQANPDVIALLASKSDPDWCEKKENQRECMAVNFTGTINVAVATQKYKVGLVLLSTDHIFNGKRGPYREDYPYYVPNIFGQREQPVNYYGLSKVAAEGLQLAYPHMKIVRTSYLFDAERLKTKQDPPPVWYPTFLFRSFMHSEHFTQSFKKYLDRFFEMPNILHISGTDTVSWYQFAKSYVTDREIKSRTQDIIKAFDVAPRPYKAGLRVDLSAKFGLPQYSYLDGIRKMKDEQ